MNHTRRIERRIRGGGLARQEGLGQQGYNEDPGHTSPDAAPEGMRRRVDLIPISDPYLIPI